MPPLLQHPGRLLCRGRLEPGGRGEDEADDPEEAPEGGSQGRGRVPVCPRVLCQHNKVGKAAKTARTISSRNNFVLCNLLLPTELKKKQL